MKPPNATCKNCLFWDFAKEIGVGYCKRNPPQLMVRSQIADSAWPVTYAEDWCGEFLDRSKSWPDK